MLIGYINTNKIIWTSSLLMELSKVGNKINSAGKNKQCTIQVKDITIDIMSRTLVFDIFIKTLLQNILLKCNNILLKKISSIIKGFMKIFLSLFILFNYNFVSADHHHDHDHHDDHSKERREGAVHVHGYNQVDLITNDNIMKITYTMPIVQLNDEHDEKNDDHDHHHHDNEEKTPDLSSFKNHNLVFETSKNANAN